MAKFLGLDEFVVKLFDVEGLKFGDFVMRTGEHTPVYIDMRVIWSYPDLVNTVCHRIMQMIQEKGFKYNHVCGLPYQGLPIASFLCTQNNTPMLLKRKEKKNWGTKQTMEGHYKHGDTVMIVDDVIMTGGCLNDDVKFLREQGLKVSDAVVFFDREQGGIERIKQIHNVDIHCVLTLTKAFEYLVKAERVTGKEVDKTMNYIRTNRFDTAEYLSGEVEENGEQ